MPLIKKIISFMERNKLSARQRLVLLRMRILSWWKPKDNAGIAFAKAMLI